jgi:hypothetical protein
MDTRPISDVSNSGENGKVITYFVLIRCRFMPFLQLSVPPSPASEGKPEPIQSRTWGGAASTT